MLSRSLARATSRSVILLEQLPPAFLLPLRQVVLSRRRSSSSSTTTNATTAYTTDPAPPPHAIRTRLSSSPLATQPSDSNASAAPPRIKYPQLSQRHSPFPSASNPLSTSLHLLPHLVAQPPFYIRIHIHARPYIITAGDTIRLPFLMPHATPGTVLRLNKATMLGSRDYTFRGDPYVDEKFFTVRAMVTGVESEPLRVKVKRKQRNRKRKTVKSKGRFTVLCVQQLDIHADGNGIQGESKTE